MKKCPYCGSEVEDNVNNCPKCKASIPHEDHNEAEESVRVQRRKNKE